MIIQASNYDKNKTTIEIKMVLNLGKLSCIKRKGVTGRFNEGSRKQCFI